MLALVAAVELAIADRRDDLIHPLGESWRFAAKAAETQAVGCDVLCFGDSLVKYGVLPKVIEEKTGLKSYSLACSGGTAPSASMLLRKALDAGARPKAVVVDFDALLVVDPGPPQLLNYPELATTRDCLELAQTLGNLGFFGELMVAKILPSACYRFEIRDSIRAFHDGRSVSQRDSVRSHRLIWARERGAHPVESATAPAVATPPIIERFCPLAWSCPPVDEAYIDRFLDLAGSRGIKVYWLLPPLLPEIIAHRVARGTDATYERFARRVAARHPGAVVLDARHAGYDNSTFVDPLHLHRRGAAILTADFAARLAEDIASPGRAANWVAMPAFEGRTEGVARAVEREESRR